MCQAVEISIIFQMLKLDNNFPCVRVCVRECVRVGQDIYHGTGHLAVLECGQYRDVIFYQCIRARKCCFSGYL